MLPMGGNGRIPGDSARLDMGPTCHQKEYNRDDRNHLALVGEHQGEGGCDVSYISILGNVVKKQLRDSS
jgi:hypothetical protein